MSYEYITDRLADERDLLRAEVERLTKKRDEWKRRAKTAERIQNIPGIREVMEGIEAERNTLVMQNDALWTALRRALSFHAAQVAEVRENVCEAVGPLLTDWLERYGYDEEFQAIEAALDKLRKLEKEL